MAQPTEWLTTEKHFRIFKAECQRLVKLWGLNDWRVDFSHERLSDGRACCRADVTNRACNMVLGVRWAQKDGNGDKHYAPNDADIRECARHEAIHLLLARLYNIGQARYITEDEMNAANEGMCRHLHELLPR